MSKISLSWQGSFWVTLAIAFLLLGLFIFMVSRADSERTKRGELEAEKRYLESELFASNRLQFYCDSTMQEIYNKINVDSLLAGTHIESVDLKVFYRDSFPDSLLAVPPKDSSKWLPAGDLNLIDSSGVTE